MQVPFFSILIPTYQQAQLIHRCIEGALQQDFSDFEIIVSDDSENESAQEVVFSYNDPRIFYYQNKPGLGRVSNYRSLVLERARGEWLLICDGDDYLTDPGYLTEVHQLIHQHHSLVWIQAGHVKGESIGEGVLELPFIPGDKLMLSGNDYLKQFPVIHHFSHLSTVSKRSIMQTIDPFRYDILSADMETYLRVAAHGDICLLRKAVGLWYQHGENASATNDAWKYVDNLRWLSGVFDYWIQVYPERSRELMEMKKERLSDLLYFQFKHWLLKQRVSFRQFLKLMHLTVSSSELRLLFFGNIRFYQLVVSYLIRS